MITVLSSPANFMAFVSKVRYDLFYLFLIAVDYEIGVAVEPELIALFILHDLIRVEYAACSFGDAEIASFQNHFAGLHAGERKQIAYQHIEPVRFIYDHLQVAAPSSEDCCPTGLLSSRHMILSSSAAFSDRVRHWLSDPSAAYRIFPVLWKPW